MHALQKFNFNDTAQNTFLFFLGLRQKQHTIFKCADLFSEDLDPHGCNTTRFDVCGEKQYKRIQLL